MKTYTVTVSVGTRTIRTTVVAKDIYQARALAEAQYGSGNVQAVS